MSTVQIKLPPLYPKQSAIFYAPERVSVCDASTKAGKSVGALTWLLYQSLNVTPGSAHLYVSAIYAQAKVMFERLCRWMTKADPGKTFWESNKTDLWVKVGQSIIWFKGGDNPDGIYGTDYAAAVIDEASRTKPELWHAVRSTLTATGGPVRIIGNVKGRKNWAWELGARARSGEPGMVYHRLTASDAVEGGIMPASEIEEARRHLPEPVFRELYLAEPNEDGSNPFGLDAIRACVMPLPMVEAKPAYWGVDLAKSHDWTVAVGLTDRGEVCQFHRWQGPWAITEARLAHMIGATPALVDSTGVGDPIVEMLQKRCPNVEGFKFSNQSKQQLMTGLAAAIHKRAIKFPAGPIVDELESFEFSYSAGGSVSYSAPDGLHDDCVCALALAVHKLGGFGEKRPTWGVRVLDWDESEVEAW